MDAAQVALGVGELGEFLVEGGAVEVNECVAWREPDGFGEEVEGFFGLVLFYEEERLISQERTADGGSGGELLCLRELLRCDCQIALLDGTCGEVVLDAAGERRCLMGALIKSFFVTPVPVAHEGARGQG